MAGKLVTIKDICKRSGIHPSSIYARIYHGDFPAPLCVNDVPLKPYRFNVSDINRWIIDYGSKLITMHEVASMLQISNSTVDYLIRKHGFPCEHVITANGPMWLRISVIYWRKKHPSWHNLIKDFMRQNK